MAPFHECPSSGSHARAHTGPAGVQAGAQKWGFSQGRRQERTAAPTGQLMSTAQGLCPRFCILVFVLCLETGLPRVFQK